MVTVGNNDFLWFWRWSGWALGAGSAWGGWRRCLSCCSSLPSLPSLRGALCGAFCGASRRLLVASGILVGLAASAALRAFYNVFAAWCCGWWCPASQAAWALILGGWWCSPAGRWRWIVSEAWRGSLASPGRCDGLRGWQWVLALSGFRRAVTGLCGVSCGGLSSLSRGLSCGRLVGVVAGRGSVGVVGLTGLCGLPVLS